VLERHEANKLLRVNYYVHSPALRWKVGKFVPQDPLYPILEVPSLILTISQKQFEIFKSRAFSTDVKTSYRGCY